ncbi:MAG TPA: HD domain-containing phosphohydrolase [Solirubrobacteraceae bacterium]|nr:HD domain-containing phosphohydrolase [Solirubrobacteraceae bacterium]
MSGPALDDVRSRSLVQRLLEDSWRGRSRRAGSREIAVELCAGALFLGFAVPLAVTALSHHHVDLLLAIELVVMYALASRLIRFPIGAGYVVPSYLVLVPMLLLLPSGLVPLLTAAALVLGTIGQVLARQVGPERVVFAVPDAWHTLGPTAVLLLAGQNSGLSLTLVYVFAFIAGCVVDLVSSTLRETAIIGVAPHVQTRVIALVWLIDCCIAPLGLLLAHAARHDSAQVLLIVPFYGVMLLLSRDRNSRIEQAQRRLDLVARERTRLQSAVGRLGEALSAKLDLDALTKIVLHGSIEALDADAGCLTLSGPREPQLVEVSGSPRVALTLRAAAQTARGEERPCQLEREGTWALALPLGFSTYAGRVRGALAVARQDRPFRPDEQAVMEDLVERAREAAGEIVVHELLREQAHTDTLTKLGNRRKLAVDLDQQLRETENLRPLVLALFDLDGFKSYNDTFGHLAGDAVLTRLGGKLSAAVSAHGAAYRLGGDEFCVLIRVDAEELAPVFAAAAAALTESGENFAVGSSYGAVLLPHEAKNLDFALQLADQRMYERKRGRGSRSGGEARDVLVRIMSAHQPGLESQSTEVAALCLRIGRRFAMSAEGLDELVRAAELHDIGKVGIPDAILQKPAELNESEWVFIHQHTILGERILSAAPALRPIAALVRATHERWSGGGYPDRLHGEQIPLGARIIAVCDAYHAMVSERPYRTARAHHEACAELRAHAGTQFDPAAVAALLEELGEDSAPELSSLAGEPRAHVAEEVADYLRRTLAEHDDGAIDGSPEPVDPPPPSRPGG